jgi:hypothetical protein
MKNKMILLFMLAIPFSCSKDRLTKETQTGANTISCKIDGKVFKPSESGGLFGTSPITVYNYPYSGFTVLAKYYETENGNIPKDLEINLFYLKEKGIYDLGVNPYAIYRFSYWNGPTYHTNNFYTGQVKITRCDTVNKIYSGTFFFTAIDGTTGKVVNVTDGRFDVKGR